MRRVCGWCKKDLNPEQDHISDAPVTHGICSSCALQITTGTSRSAREMLNMVEEPVFLLGQGGVMHAANRSGCQLVGKEVDAVVDRMLGEVFECAEAGRPGGCGMSIHCSMCTMRNTLLETLDTGNSASKVPATRNLGSPEGERDVHFLISTEQVDGRILMKIDEVNGSDDS